MDMLKYNILIMLEGDDVPFPIKILYLQIKHFNF